MSLQYRGLSHLYPNELPIELSWEVVLFSNSNSIVLSHSENSLLIFAGDITIALIEVTGNSAAGKGIRVKSAGASITNLNLLADMGLTFIDDAYVLNVENLNVNSPAKLTGDGNGGWLKCEVTLCYSRSEHCKLY